MSAPRLLTTETSGAILDSIVAYQPRHQGLPQVLEEIPYRSRTNCGQRTKGSSLMRQTYGPCQSEQRIIGLADGSRRSDWVVHRASITPAVSPAVRIPGVAPGRHGLRKPSNPKSATAQSSRSLFMTAMTVSAGASTGLRAASEHQETRRPTPKGWARRPDGRIGCIFTGSRHCRQGVARAGLGAALAAIKEAGGGLVEGSRAKPRVRPIRQAARSARLRNSEKNLQSTLISGTRGLRCSAPSCRKGDFLK